MKKCVAALILIVMTPIVAAAAELVMFDSPFCEWCERWQEDIGVVYGKTPAGEFAPLRRLDINASRPAELKSIRGVVYTPTFVLVDSGREVGRIVGYPGESHFWELLDEMIGEMRAARNACGETDRQSVAGSHEVQEERVC